jgi:hypothetical protein
MSKTITYKMRRKMSVEQVVILQNLANQEADPDAFIKKAKFLVAENFNTTFLSGLESKAGPQHFYVTTFTKTLGNWKAMVSTDLISGQYWEVTHNGAKNETYVDHYNKRGNAVFSDQWYASVS